MTGVLRTESNSKTKDISSVIVRGVAGLSIMALEAQSGVVAFIEGAELALIRSGGCRRGDRATLVNIKTNDRYRIQSESNCDGVKTSSAVLVDVKVAVRCVELVEVGERWRRCRNQNQEWEEIG